MRRPNLTVLLALVATAALAFPTPALADGIIIPEPPICDPGPCPPIPISQLAIEYHRVRVTVEGQVAVTHVDQVFRNDNDWPVEGTYVFPLPPDASVTNFRLWIDGRSVEGRVLSREEARQVYEDIVRRLRDPALLEYVDRGAVQASIFPIPAGGESRVELEYTQVLMAENGLFHYRYPLNTERFSTLPLEDVSVAVEVDSDQAVHAIYSPSHTIAVSRDGDYRFTASYEESGVTPQTDFDLYYSVAAEEIGLSLLTYRDPASDDPDGFFLLLAAPRLQLDPEERIAKDVMVVLDTSGSMEGEKFSQAREALDYILAHLNPEDRFNVIAFNTSLEAYASGLRPASEAGQARRWAQGLSAGGATDINRALLEALDQLGSERPSILIFLTDGLPTEGVQDRESILDNIARAAPDGVRLFAFGVGYDVDTLLLDSLAQDHHGATTYVTPEQSIDEAVSALYAKVSSPVLTDLEFDFGQVPVYDLHPDPLPDLFQGSQIVLVGRYADPGADAIRLSGTVNGDRLTFDYEDHTFRASGGPDFIPRLWATRKIGDLLNQIRLEGPEEELVQQVVRLSIRYGIVTPYTSYLVTEPNALGAEAQQDLAQQEFQRLLAAPTMASGQAAVERAAAESAIGGADIAAAPPAEAADLVRVVGQRTFRLIDGVWIDTAFDPETMTTTRVAFLSPDYFALAAARPELAAAFALGTRVIALSDGTAYEVVDEGAPADAITIPPTDSPGTTTEVPTGQPPAAPGAASPFGLSCPTGALAFGLVLLPLGLRRRRH
ncbi:MAG: VIT domain-containing protein [Chloroflexota bacterium]